MSFIYYTKDINIPKAKSQNIVIVSTNYNLITNKRKNYKLFLS